MPWSPALLVLWPKNINGLELLISGFRGAVEVVVFLQARDFHISC